MCAVTAGEKASGARQATEQTRGRPRRIPWPSPAVSPGFPASSCPPALLGSRSRRRSAVGDARCRGRPAPFPGRLRTAGELRVVTPPRGGILAPDAGRSLRALRASPAAVGGAWRRTWGGRASGEVLVFSENYPSVFPACS